MKIIGNPLGAPVPRTDYNQEDPAKSDYLKGREVIAQKLEEAVQAAGTGLSKTGGTMEGPIDMGGNALTGLPAPAAAGDAASWGAVQGAVQAAAAAADAHAGAKTNPHAVTAAQAGAVEMKLLWTNASPGSTFAAQTISLSLSGYAYVAIDYRPLGTALAKRQFCKVGETCLMDAVSGNSGGGMSGTVYGIWRQAEVKTSGVVFTKAVKREIGASASIADDNDYMKPFRIFGIKGVK